MMGAIANHPFASLALCIALLALPFLVSARSGLSTSTPQWLRWYATAAGAFLATAAIVLMARYLIVALPLIEGVDFFYYICIARDYLLGFPDASLLRYAYFPGGYRTWQFMMGLLGTDLPAIQVGVVLLLLANAFLVAVIAKRCVDSWAAGLIGAIWYLAIAMRFEGLHGTTEPIGSIYALAGLLAWGGLPLQGSAGWRRALLLGIGLGLAAWSKQQCGLVAIGAIVIAIQFAVNRREIRDSFWIAAAIPCVSIVTLLGACLLEGQGSLPLSIGLGLMGEYETQGSLSANLQVVVRQAGMAAWFVFVASFLWLAALGAAFATGKKMAPATAVAGFSLFATIAAAAQYSKRPYLHYALLAAPFVAIMVSVMAMQIVQAASALWPRMKPLTSLTAAGLLTLPMIGSAGSTGHFQLWPPAWTPAVAHGKPWHEAPEIASDLQSIQSVLAPGEDVLVLPTRRNVIHFMAGTRSVSNPDGYGWGPSDVSDALRAKSLAAVVVLDRRILDESDLEACKDVQCDRAIAMLAQAGFVESARFPTMTVWRRPAGGRRNQ